MTPELAAAIAAVRKEADWYDTRRWVAHGDALKAAADLLEQQQAKIDRWQAWARGELDVRPPYE